MKYIKSFLTILLFCFVTTLFAQKRVTGHVWNKADGPIVMATVVEVDPNGRIVSATSTDVHGNFTLQVKNNNNRLRASYVGHKMAFVPIGNNTTFKIELQDLGQLGEATVTARKKAMSGGLEIPEKQISTAVQTLNMDALEGLSFETAGEALQGQIAGLDIVANSGNLGSGTSMRLRGVTSISGTQEPLIVVNGNILEDYTKGQLDVGNLDNQEQFANLLQVNPEDIKKIEVLKDAAAAAVWGSRGANGVILIETRRGSRGPTKVTFSYRFSGSWQPQGKRMLSGDEYTMMLKEGYFNPKQSSLASQIVELSYRPDRTLYYANYDKNTDWVKEVSTFGQVHNYGLTVMGGGEKAQFRVSANYDNESGIIIKQKLQRFNTRMALDYWVSERMKFSSNFSMVYIRNVKNNGNILERAYKAMPNMSITRWEYDKNSTSDYPYYDTGEYFRMFPAYSHQGEVPDGYTSYFLRDMVENGNPVAIANKAWVKESAYTIEPEFYVDYKLLGLKSSETELNYTGKVFMSSYTNTNEGFFPAELESKKWSDGVNRVNQAESKRMRFETTHSLTFKPHFENEDHVLQARIEGQLRTFSGTDQNMAGSGFSGGITDPSVEAYTRSMGSSISEGRSLNATFTSSYAYQNRYSLLLAARADGSTKFGAGKKWGLFPSISGRWNINEEKFFEPLKKVVSLLSIRMGWGVTGNQAIGEGSMYNKYHSVGYYGNVNSQKMDAFAPSGLRLVNIRWETTTAWNLGFNLNLFEDLLQFDVNIYNKHTYDLIQSNMRIPSSVGFRSLSAANVGELKNYGWELNFSTNRIKLVDKLGLRARLNLAQNINRIHSMNEVVLKSLNAEFNYGNPHFNWLKRVQVGNALGGIYGFRYKGIYRYDYDHSGYFRNKVMNDRYGGYTEEFGAPTAKIAAEYGENATTPVAIDKDGNVVYDVNGNPVPMVYNFGGVGYQFSGGDVIYEDINNDGQINGLDVVYLGSSNPILNGGFGFTLEYDRWQLNTNFSYRIGNKVINQARMWAESMRDNMNQSRAVNWRWRKNGDITEIPRAMNSSAGPSYNSMPNDRFVERADFVRFNYLQLSYNFPSEKIKKWGMSSLSCSLSGNNLIFWSKYSGVDPEHAAGGYSPAMDNSKTPRGKSFTFSLRVGF